VFKLIFWESLAENSENAHFNFNEICPRFVSSLFFNTLNHNFCNKTTVWQKSIKALFNPELNTFYHTETCQIGKPTHPPRKI
jgi:hypothetical protein